MPNPAIVFSPIVADALNKGQPVVALESTIITHGMPYPANQETAQAVEQAVRDSNAVPATIAIINGIPTVSYTHLTLPTICSV